MRVSQRLDYTLRGLVALVAQPAGTYVVAGDLADKLGLPRRFLEQQFTAIAKRGLVTSQRGAGGGTALARPASEMTVGDVVRAVQGQVIDVPHVAGSATSEMWAAVAEDVAASVDKITLAELARRQAELDEGLNAMYHI